MRNKKSFLIILLFLVSVFALSKCINSATAADPRGELYAGAASCRQCHQAVYDSLILTAHYNSTATANTSNIHGNFTAGFNTFNYTNGTQVKMEKRDSGYFQVLYENGKEKAAYRFDVVFGGKNAQTFIYWKDRQAFELPVSHYSFVNAWGTSPGGGYTSAAPYFQRPVSVGCFECHSSAAGFNTEMSGNGVREQFIPAKMIYGIDCERCHGPGANHVNYHNAYPDEKQAKYMVKNRELTRQQQDDACAVCHGGNDKTLMASRFEFQMGDTLANFMMPFGQKKNPSPFDVHGNQSGLLAQSKCSKGIAALTCNTCHTPHSDASRDLAMYSQKCMSCHTEGGQHYCPKANSIGPSIKSNCIDCHMPKQGSQAIQFQLSESVVQSEYMLRTHKIAIYTDSVFRK